VSTITADTSLAPADTRSRGRMQRAARRWRYASNAGAAILAVLLLVWTLAPLYNMVMVAFEAEGDVFSDHLWPPKASGYSFWIVLSQGYWYLEYFWHQFGNSVFIGVMVTLFVLVIGSLTTFSTMRLRIRNGWVITNAALLTYVIRRHSWRSHSI
jgi:multiple sugar transport system permease protein